jgi:hypothetical protein
MATIRKSPLSPYWQAVLTLPDGRRTNRSTKCTSKTQAQLIAAQYQEMANKAREGTLFTDHAKKVFNDLLEQAGQDTLHDDTTENFLQEWLKGKPNDSTRERYSGVVNVFLKAIGGKARGNLRGVSHKDVLGFMAMREKQGFAPKTLNIETKILKSAFNTAKTLGFISDNPVAKALILHPIDVSSSERDPFTPAQVESLLNTAQGDWLAYYFNGTSGYTSGDYISASVSNLPTGSAPRTVTLWAKANPVNPYQGTTLLFWGTNQNGEAFQVLNNSIPYTWQGGGWGGGNDVNTGLLVDTNWHFVVQSYDGSGMTMWIDGTNYGTANISINSPLSPLLIGTGIELDYFTGAINEVRIYNRVLSTNEISELFQSFATGIIALPTVTISGTTNQTYSIQYVNNLSNTNWTTLVSNIVLQGSSPYYYPDTNSIGQPYRFYRVVAQ